MLQLNENDVAIHFCTFQAYLQKAKVNLRFPSLFFVEWKTINGKNAVGMVGRKRAINSMIELNETLLFTTEMLYHRTQKQYLKKQSLFHLNLISNSRPDQVKLVGRVVIDLSEIANTNKYHSITTNKLMYCSVDAQISFSLKLSRSVQSNIELNQLDRSSFSDLYSFTTSFRNAVKNKIQTKDVVIQRRVQDQRRKIKTKFNERQEIFNKNGMNPKAQNILIKDLIQQVSQEKSQPQSLPLTQRKPTQTLLTPQKTPINSTSNQNLNLNNEIQKLPNPNQFQQYVHKQKDNLQRQLNQHKNKIKKLQNDMKQAMKLFQQSQQHSQLNKSKLIESEQMINNLKGNEEKLKQFHQKEIDNVKEANIREIELLKAGYDADIKILLGTIEQLRIKAQDSDKNKKTIEEQYQQVVQQNNDLRYKMTNQESILEQLAQINNKNIDLQKERQSFLVQINKKSIQLTKLQQQLSNFSKEKQENLTLYNGEINVLKQTIRNKQGENQLLKSQFNEKIKTFQKQIENKSLDYQSKKQQLKLQINQISLKYQQKLAKQSQLLLKIQQQKQQLQKQIALNKIPNENILNQQGIQNYQKLKEQHKKLTLQLQKIKKSIIFPEDYKKVMQEDINADLFVIMQKSQLQEIQLSELRQQNQTIKQKITQLIKEHQQIKSSRSQQLQNQELNLIKQQLIKAKQQEEKYIKIQQQLQRLVNQSKIQINRLNQNIQIYKTNQPERNEFMNKQENVNIQLKQIKYESKLKRQIQENPVQFTSQGDHLIILDQPHHDHQHHHFNFDDHNNPLTHQEINKISQIKDINTQQVQYLMEQIFKLKEQIQELRHEKINNNQLMNNGMQNHSTSIQLLQSLRKLQQENQQLKKNINKDNIQQLSISRHQQKKHKDELTDKYLTQLQQENKDHKTIISNLQVNLVDLEKKNQELQYQIKNPPETAQLLEKYNVLLRELEGKLANLQQQMKIKDQLLAEGQKNLEQNYTMKYELADLKDKYSQIKSALEQRDQMINYLQQTKQQLSKQLQQAAQKSQHLAFNIQSRQIAIQQPLKVQFGQQQLSNQIQALKKELVILNNKNTQLRNSLQEKINQNLSIERINQQNLTKIQQYLQQKRQLQVQVGDLSLIINGLNVQIQKSKYEIQSMNEQINNLSLRNNQTALMLDLKQKNQEVSKLQRVEIPKLPLQQNQEAKVPVIYETEYKKLTEDFNNLQMNHAQICQALLKKQEKIATLSLQLQSTKRKLEQLLVENKNEGNPIKTQLFQVQIHEIDSINECMPIEYSKSTIPLYERDELQKIQREKILKKLHQQIQFLKQSNKQLLKQLADQSQQKYAFFNNLEVSNTKVNELQRQVSQMKDQIEKLTSLPIQSFNYMATPIKAHHYAQTYSRNLREPSIMYQPRVKAEISQQSQTPIKNSFQKDTPLKQNYSKNIQTRVQTNVEPTSVNENEVQLLKKQLQIVKQQLESEGKLHNELRQIHKMCQEKYQLLNKHYQNCLEQINCLKSDNQLLNNVKQDITNELYEIKHLLEKSQSQNDQLLRRHNEVILNKPQVKKQNLSKPKAQQANLQPASQQINLPEKIQFSLQQKMQYEHKLSAAIKNQEKLNKKIFLLQENIHNLQKSFQQHIQSAQSNDKISEKLQQLYDLQSMATNLQQQAQDFRLQNQQLTKVKAEKQQLLLQKQQLQKIAEEHVHCIEQRAQWQQKLNQIEYILSNNQNKFSQEKQQLQNKVIMLNQQNASLVAQKSAIYQTIKKQSSFVIDNQIQQLRAKQAQLFLQIQALRSEKLNQMQKVIELQQKLNKDAELINKKQAEYISSFNHKEEQIQQVKFINIQLNQELQEIKMHLSQNQLANNNIKTESKKLIQEKERNIQQISNLKEKVQEQLNLIDKLTQSLKEQVKIIQQERSKAPQIQKITSQLQKKQAQIIQKSSLIQQLLQKLKTTENQLQKIQKEIQIKNQEIKSDKLKLQQSLEKIKKNELQNKQLATTKQKIQIQLQKANARYLELQNAVKNTSRITESKEKLSQNLKSQINKKQQQIKDLTNKIQSKEKDIINLNKQLFGQKENNKKYQLKIQQLIQKQVIMKQTMQIIENQSKKIVQALQNRYESQQNYYRLCMQKQKQNNKLNLSVIQARQQAENKERILTYEQQKANQLKNQIQIMKNSIEIQSAMSSRIVTIQYDKYEKLMHKNQQLMNKNKQYLQIINNKSTSSIQNEKLKQEIKQILQKMNQFEQNHNQAKQQLNYKLPQLQKQLQLANKQNKQLHQRISQIMKELNQTKQASVIQNHQSIENLIAEKDNQINTLKKTIKKIKQPQNFSSIIDEQIDNSNISILNEQILNLNRQLLQKQSQLNKLKIQIHTLPLPVVSEIPETHLIQDEQKQKLKNQLLQREKREQQYKQSISKLKALLISTKQTNEVTEKVQNNKIETVSHDLHNLCEEIKDLCQKRNSKEQSDKLFQAFLQKYDIMEQQFNNLNCQTSIIQQKAKFISKQLQKIKSFIIKNQNRSFKQKTQLLAMIKPCETAASELVNISQTLSEKESQNFI